MTYIVPYYNECSGDYIQVHVEAPSAEKAACRVEARDDCTKVCVVAPVAQAELTGARP